VLLDRLQHVGEAPEDVRTDRFALERAGPHSRQLTLVRGDAEMVGPERDQPLGETALGQHRALQSRQRLGAKGLLDDIERLRRFCRSRRGGVGRPFRLHRGVGWLRVGHRLPADIGRHRVEREIAPQLVVRLLLGRLRRRRCFSWDGRLRGFARLLDLVLIGEHGLPELRRRLQARRFQQHAVRAR